ncbi:hypothetical protein BGX38DRAFT_1292288 [Terfezia claveryi]|nr:hypothetical protein BGX38DRAFT_1292288 [Terfezia claveryi]
MNNPLPGQRSPPSSPLVIAGEEEWEVEDISKKKVASRRTAQRPDAIASPSASCASCASGRLAALQHNQDAWLSCNTIWTPN